MRDNRNIGEKAFDAVNVIIMAVLLIVTFYPLYHVLMASFSDPDRVVGHSGLLLYPLSPNLEGYKAVFTYKMITSSFRNTLFIIVTALTLNMLLTAFAAYFLSRKDIMLRGVVMKLIVVTMFFSGGLIPFYLTVNGLGLSNSLLSVILPFAVNTFNLIIMRTSFSEIPDSLIEAAEMEGANDFTILFRIVLPVSKATLAVIALYYLVQHWNAWFYASIFIDKRELLPFQVILREILIQNSTDNMKNAGDSENMYEVIKYAVIVVGTVPILIVYPFLQKYFVKGVMIGSVKG